MKKGPSIAELRRQVKAGRIRLEDVPVVSQLARVVDAVRKEALQRRAKWRARRTGKPSTLLRRAAEQT